MNSWEQTQTGFLICILNVGIDRLKKEIPNYKHDIDEQFLNKLHIRTNSNGYVEFDNGEIRKVLE